MWSVQQLLWLLQIFELGILFSFCGRWCCWNVGFVSWLCFFLELILILKMSSVHFLKFILLFPASILEEFETFNQIFFLIINLILIYIFTSSYYNSFSLINFINSRYFMIASISIPLKTVEYMTLSLRATFSISFSS